MNSTASQSSNSGWLGRSPCTPKSSVVFTSPMPKNICQERFTVTRAVSGCPGADNQRASPRRLVGASAGKEANPAGTAAATGAPGFR